MAETIEESKSSTEREVNKAEHHHGANSISESSKSSTHQPIKEESVSKEFNTRSTLAVLGSALAIFSTIGWLNSFGPLLQYWSHHQLEDKTSFQITWIGSFTTFMFFVAAAPAGLLVDRVGPTLPMSVGAIIYVLALFLLSVCKEYYQFFLVQGILLGIGGAFLTCPCLAVVSKHFNKNRGLATGLTIAGSSLGGVVLPIMLDQLLTHRHLSFGWTVRIIGFMILPIVIIACILVQNPKEKATEKPEEGPSSGQPAKPKKKTDLSILKNKVYLTYCAGLGVYYLGMFTPFFFVTSYAVDLGMTTSLAFYLVSMLNGASLFGRISAGVAADKLGHFNLCSIAALTSAIICYCWTAADSTAGLIVWSIAYGFSSGSIMSLQMACASKLATPQTYGTAVGMAMFIVSLTGLFGAPISGELIKSGYLSLSMYAASALMAGALLIVAARLQLSRSLTALV